MLHLNSCLVSRTIFPSSFSSKRTLFFPARLINVGGQHLPAQPVETESKTKLFKDTLGSNVNNLREEDGALSSRPSSTCYRPHVVLIREEVVNRTAARLHTGS